jgi:hypothetical protein
MCAVLVDNAEDGADQSRIRDLTATALVIPFRQLFGNQTFGMAPGEFFTGKVVGLRLAGRSDRTAPSRNSRRGPLPKTCSNHPGPAQIGAGIG